MENNVEIKEEFLPVDAGDNENTAQDAYTAPVDDEPEQAVVEETPFVSVEKMPEFPGGEEALYKYLSKNLKYPDIAKEQNLQGKVFVQFIVEKDGSISNPKAVRDIGGGCGEEAVRVVRGMPKWTPGKQRTQTVRVQYTLPVVFQLE